MPADGTASVDSLSVIEAAFPRQARLAFARSPDGVTYLREQRVGYPFHICRPFHMEGDPSGMASLYLQSCAGGIFEDDHLGLDVTMDAGSAVHLTTQASTIVHTMTRGRSRVASTFEVGPNAWFEMIADPLILFPGSSLTAETQLVVDPTAIAVLADAFLLHDPAGEYRPFARLDAETVIEVAGRGRVACDRYAVAGATVLAGMPGVTGRYRAQGTLLAVAPDGRFLPLVGDLRRALSELDGIYAGVSTLPGNAGLWCRILAEGAPPLRRALDELWSVLRTRSTGQVPRRRRK
jgi:urease accessory protein